MIAAGISHWGWDEHLPLLPTSLTYLPTVPAQPFIQPLTSLSLPHNLNQELHYALLCFLTLTRESFIQIFFLLSEHTLSIMVKAG